jgi:hypothetical protein
MLPNDFPPWEIVCQQTRRWKAVGRFEAMVHDLSALLQVIEARAPTPTAVILDARALQSTPESGAFAGLHFVAFAFLMLHRALFLFTGS